MTLPKLLLVTDRRASPLPVVEAVRGALEALPSHSAIVLLREKDLDTRPLLALAKELRSITAQVGALLAISSRVDVALACDADAVQLGRDAPPFEAVRALAAPSLRIGVSLHGDETAPAGAAWGLLAPVFPTTSKPGATTLGIEALARRCRELGPLPVFALGGIAASNAASCLQVGAFGVAVRGAVLGSTDPARAALALHAAIAR